MVQKSRRLILVKLLIILMIVAIFAIIALPNYVSYRNKQRVLEAMSTMDSVRKALESFASTCFGHLYPADSAIIDWSNLAKICNENGAMLKLTEEESGITFISYDRKDSNLDGVDDTYVLVVEVTNLPNEVFGKRIIVTPSGLIKQSM